MSFGFSVGDFIAVATLARDVHRKYRAMRGAPENFRKTANEVASLHVVLQEAEEILFARPLKPEREARIKTVADGCTELLNDLDAYVKKYESLGTIQDKRTRDRWKFANDEFSEMRARLMSNIGMLNLMINTSQLVVEQRLNSFITSIDPIGREGSIRSFRTAYSALEVAGDASANDLAALAAMDTENMNPESVAFEPFADPNSQVSTNQGSNPWFGSSESVDTDAGDLDVGIDTREGSIRSFETARSLNRSEITAWKDARREFESVGITVSAYQANREFILGWFKDALESGEIAANAETSNTHGISHADGQFSIAAIPAAERSPALVNEVESLYKTSIEIGFRNSDVQSESQEVDFEAKRRAVLKLIHDLISLKLSRYHIAFLLQ